MVRFAHLPFLTQVQYRHYPSFRRLCEPRSRCGFFWKQTSPLLLPVIEPRFFGCLARNLVIIATTLSKWSYFAVVINLFAVHIFFYNQNYHASYHWGSLDQCFSTFVRPRPSKFFSHKTRARSQQIYSSVPFQFFFISYIKLTQVLIINYGIIIKSISTFTYTVRHVDKYKITFKLVINFRGISRGPV